MAVSLNILAAVRESTSGKLVIFAGLEAGVGKAICAANVAVRLSQRWKCVVIDMDAASGNLHKYLGVPPPDPRTWESPEDPFTSLSSFKTKTRFPNLDFIHWSAEFPPVDLFCQTLQSYPADYVFLTLNPGASDEALDLFAAADIPILVTSPSGAMQDKALDFLRRFSWRGFGDRQVYIILNQLQRGGEERENKALIEKARHSFGLNVNVFGTVLYNPDALTNIFLGAAPAPPRSKSQTTLVFEDMTLKIERLLPRGDSSKGGNVPARRAAGLVATLSESAREAVAASIGGKSRRLEEELRRKDEIIRSLHQRYDVAVADLQQMLKNRNAQVADHAATIQALQEEIRQGNDRISERTNRFLDLESAIATREAEVRNLQDQIQRFEQTNAMLALDRTEAMRRVTEQLAEQARQAGEAEHTIAAKHAEIRGLEGELNRIQEDSRALAQEIAREKQEKLSLQALNQRVIAELSQKAAQLSEMISSQAKLESDFKDAIAAERMEIQRVEDELSRIKEANRALTEEKLSLQQANREIKDESSEIQRLKDEIDRHAEDTRILTDENTALQRTNQGIAVERNETVRRLTKQLKDENRRSSELEAAIAENRSEIQRLKDEAGRIVEPSPDLTEQLAAQTRRADELEATIAASQGDVHRIEEEINQLRDANSALGGQMAEQIAGAAELEALIAANQAHIHSLEDELSRLRNTNSLLAEEKRALQHTTERILAETAQRNDSLRQLGEQLSERSARTAELEAFIAANQTRVHKLEDELNRLKEANSELAKGQLALQRTTEGILARRDDTIRQLGDQLFERTGRAAELEAAAAARRADVDRLEIELNAIRESNRVVIEEKIALHLAGEGSVVEHQETIRQFTEQLAQQRRRAGEIETDLAAARSQIHGLEDTNRTLNQERLLLQLANESAVTERNETVRHLDEKLSDRTQRTGELEIKLSAADSEILSLRQELNALAGEKGALRREIDEVALERDEAVRRLGEETSNEKMRTDELEAAIASQRVAVEQLQVEIRRLNGMNELFMEEKATLRHENERLVTERSDIGRRIAELEDVLREREALIERKDKMIQDVEVRLAQRASDHGTIEDRTAEALRQLSCEIALQREDSRTMVESCRNLAQSIEQLTRVVTEQVNEIARSRDHLRLEISEVEESRRVKYTSVPPAERPKKFHAVNNPPPKLELVPSSENTSAKLDLGALLRQRRTLVESLRKQPPHSVTIIPIIEGGKDSFDFAIELQAILESGGWSVGFVTSTFEANQFYGLHIVTDGSNIAQSTASILSTAFRKGRVGFTETTAESSGGLDPVRLIVGIHNVALIVSSTFS